MIFIDLHINIVNLQKNKIMKKLIFLLLVLPTFSLAQCWRLIDTGENHTLAIRNDGTLWSWGSNNFYKLGYDTPSGTNPNPNKVGNGNDWIQISADQWHSTGIKTNGTLWAWGHNYYGECGQGTSGTPFAIVSAPTQIGLDNNWQSVSAGTDYTLAIKNDGTLWGTGTNSSGQLGMGSSFGAVYITQIGTDTNWAQVSAGVGLSLVLKSDGTLWTWGTGYLGNGNAITTSNIPIQIGAETNWQKISKNGSFAIKMNNTLWGWGYNQFGQLGDGTTINRETPIQIGIDADWLKIINYYHHTVAIKTNNSLWTWGYNNYGQLGDGTLINKITPFQIGSETNWDDISCGEYFSTAVKTDGTLFSWGINYDGRLGDGTTVDKNVPTLINCAPLETENFLNNLFGIYPNPTTDKIFISNTTNIAINNVKVMDVTGKVILEKTNNFSEINLQSVKNGIYFLSITSDNKTKTYKIVKI